MIVMGNIRYLMTMTFYSTGYLGSKSTNMSQRPESFSGRKIMDGALEIHCPVGAVITTEVCCSQSGYGFAKSTLTI